MPLLGKIVVIRRNGADGTEFPLTASCLFGRKLDCDIRIQLPQVSKEHCRIELNENKELILTNLSSVNPTRINGESLQQSERLKHGDLITIIDRSFRFEYPPPSTPKKKRSSTTEKGETVKVLQDQQVKSTPGSTDKRKSEHSSDTCLKDGSNLPISQDLQVTKGDDGQQNTENTMSPFSELYHMVKRDLASKSPWKAGPQPKSPLATPQVDKSPRKVLGSCADLPIDSDAPVTPKSARKKRRSSNVKAADSIESSDVKSPVTADPVETSVQVQAVTPAVQDSPAKQTRRSSAPITPTASGASVTPLSQKRASGVTPHKFSAEEVVQQILFDGSNVENTPKTPKGRRSAVSQPQSPAVSPKTPQTPMSHKSEPESEAKQSPRTSPRANAGKRFQVQDVSSAIGTTPASSKSKGQASGKKHKGDNLPLPVPKRKRVSFGGQLSPELFDKRLPPDSPLRRGATPGRRSLGISRKPQSLLRRASTIGLMGLHLDKTLPESPGNSESPRRASSPGKSPKASPAKTSTPAKSTSKEAKTPSPKKSKSPAKTPSPKKSKSPAKTPSPKKSKSPAKTPSPKNNKSPAKTPSPSSSPSTPKSAKRVSNASVKTPLPGDGSLTQTPRVQGRFSVSKISTPSPEQAKGDSVPALEIPQECVTPKIPLRRSSMKSSARKTPKSALKSAFEVIRSRRSGASRANLKVVSSWADIVKFGQTKPQPEHCIKKPAAKQKAPKQIKGPKRTPVRRLKNMTSTGHVDSPATIVVGKAYVRRAQPVGAAPKIVPNIVMSKKDMKMDEDLTGVADIFKTPANSKRKSVVGNREYPETPLDAPSGSLTEMSVMNTPEESGEMVVSPMNIASVAKAGCYNSDAVTRLRQDSQNASLTGNDLPMMDESRDLPVSETISVPKMATDDLMEKNDNSSEPQMMMIQTPQRDPAPLECFTGIKKLMRTPKQRAEPIEDLRGKLLKTPKEPKPAQEENFEGVKELLKTPKQKATSVEDLSGLKRMMKTPKQRAEPTEDLRGKLLKTPKEPKPAQEDNFEGVKELLKTPKQKATSVEDLSELKSLMRTPKADNSPVVCATGLKKLTKTPKVKTEQKEDLRGVKQLMQTPKFRGEAVEKAFGLKRLLKTPKEKREPVEEDLTGIQQMMKTPKQKPEPVEALTGMKRLLRTPKQRSEPVENEFGISQLMKTPKQREGEAEDLTSLAVLDPEPMSKSTPEVQSAEIQEPSMTSDLTVEASKEDPEDKENTCLAEDMCNETKMLQEEEVGTGNFKEPVHDLISEALGHVTAAMPSLPTPKKEAKLPSPAKKTRCGGRVKSSEKSQKVEAVCPVTAESKEENITVENVPTLSAPVKGRRGKTVIESLEPVSVPSPVRKSAKGRVPKYQVEDKEANHTQDLTTSQAFEEVSKYPPAVKQRRGRKAEQCVEVEPVLQVNTVTGSGPTEPLAKVEASLKSPAAVSKTKRGGKAKCKVDNPPEIPAPEELKTCDPAVEREVSTESVELMPTVEVASPVKTTGTKKGRAAKKEAPKSSQAEESKPIPATVESGTTSADVLVTEQPQIPVNNPGRGRRAKLSDLKDLAVVSELVPPEADHKPVVPAVNSDRQTKSKRLKAQLSEDADDQLTAVESSDAVTDTEEHLDTEVKNVRGNRRAKQPKAARVSAEAPKSVEDKSEVDGDAVKRSEATAIKSARGKRTVATAVDPEGPIKRGRRADAVTPPVVKPSRGRKAVVKVDQEDATAVEEPVKGAETDKTTVTQDSSAVLPAVEDAVREVPANRGRGRNTKAKTLVNEADAATAIEQPVKEAEADKIPVTQDSSESAVLAAVEDAVREVPAKRGRGRNTKAKTLVNEADAATAIEQPVKEAEADKIPVTQDSSESAVLAAVEDAVREVPAKRGRGRNTKAKILVNEADAATAIEEPVKEAEADKIPVTQDSSESAVLAAVEDAVREVPVKRGRGRCTKAKASIKGNSANHADVTAVEEPVKGAKSPASETDEAPAIQDSSKSAMLDGVEDAVHEVPVKRGRGRYAKASPKDSSVNEANDTTVEESAQRRRGASKKAVNWKSDLVTCKNFEASNPIAAEEESVQTSQKIAQRSAKASSKDTTVSETKPSSEATAKGRKGRLGKKQEEPLAEMSETVAEENASVAKRGRAGASLVSKTAEVAVCPRRGNKRKENDDIASQAVSVESLPKRRRVKAAIPEAQPEVTTLGNGKMASAEENSEVEVQQSKPTSKKDDRKPIRGKRKAAQEVDSVPAQSEVLESTRRRGTRGQKKTEEEVASAPVRRTRRK